MRNPQHEQAHSVSNLAFRNGHAGVGLLDGGILRMSSRVRRPVNVYTATSDSPLTSIPFTVILIIRSLARLGSWAITRMRNTPPER